MVNNSHAQGHVGQRVNQYRLRRRPVPSFVEKAGEIVVEPVASDVGLDVVHEWGIQSFPASDPPANW